MTRGPQQKFGASSVAAAGTGPSMQASWQPSHTNSIAHSEVQTVRLDDGQRDVRATLARRRLEHVARAGSSVRIEDEDRHAVSAIGAGEDHSLIGIDNGGHRVSELDAVDARSPGGISFSVEFFDIECIV